MTGPAPYLVADIGATNSRFSLAGDAGLSGEMVRLETAGASSGVELVDAALAELGRPAIAAACLAVAGPVQDGRGEITNGSLAFAVTELSGHLGRPVELVNDFTAQARALPELQHLRQLGGAAPRAGTKAVLGPGTGLGMGVLVPWDGGWRVLGSEGGHADLAPGSPLETELVAVLQMEHGHVSWETVLSGPGLERLYRAVCRLWGSEPEDLAAEEISERGENAADPVCHQTLELFFGLLGAAAGNLALTVYALGGVYVGGGIVPRLAEFAAGSPLRRRFEERGPMTALIRDVPLYLILDENPGLVGALACLRDALAGSGAER